MMPVPCPSCGARSSGQQPFCPSCGAARPTRLTAPRLGQSVFVSIPPVFRRRLGWKALLVGLVLSLVVVGTLASVLAGFGLFDWLGKAALPCTTGPGWWKATAPGLGTFEFHLNNDRTAISDFAFQIPQISCPSITYSVSDVQVSNDPPWRVTQGRFDDDLVLEDNQGGVGSQIDVEVSGVIASTGQQASGDWIFDGEPSPCQGSWTGSPTTA
jgi:hypothetical protein